MYICSNNNCWFTNIGEAFIDLGVKAIVHNLAKRMMLFIMPVYLLCPTHIFQNQHQTEHLEMMLFMNQMFFFSRDVCY